MKRIGLLFIISLFGIIGFASAEGTCDQNFYGSLRYYKGYIFNDTFNNPGSGSYYLRYHTETSIEQYDYNNSPDFPTFGRTSEIKTKKYEVGSGESIKVLEAKSPYYIYYVPAKRQTDNLIVKYTLTYSRDIGGTVKKNHTECKYYEITRCGDGIKDASYAEECDKTDGVSQGYTCNSQCKLVQTPKPTCTLTINPTSMLSGGTSTLSWSISGVADFPTSIISNPVLSGFPYSVSTNTGNKTFTINQIGTFGFDMIVKNSAGQNSCSTIITVTEETIPPTPSPTVVDPN